MKKPIQIILTIISSGIGLYSGFIIGMVSTLSFFKLLEIIISIDFGAMWMMFGVIAFFLGIVGGVLASIIFWMINWGRFNSYEWKINRYLVILFALIIAIVIHCIITF